MPPRFKDESIAALRRTLLQRAPACYFTADDVTELHTKEGLAPAQSLKWAGHFRERTPEALRVQKLSELEKDVEKAAPIKIKRCYVFAFNVDREFAAAFKLPKSRSNDFFSIKFLDAGLDREAYSGEFFIVFEEKVYDNKIIQAFEEAGAGCVTLHTFDANDDNASASDALVRVWATAAQTGFKYTRGICDPSLLLRTEAKMAAQQEKELNTEFDEKTVAMLKNSLNDVGGKLDNVDGKVVEVAVTVNAIGTTVGAVKDIVTQKSALETSADTEVKRLKTELARVNLLRDQEENRRGRITGQLNDSLEKIELMREKLQQAVDALYAFKAETKKYRVSNQALLAAKDESIASKDKLFARQEEIIASKDEIIARQDDIIAAKEEDIRTKDRFIDTQSYAIALHTALEDALSAKRQRTD